MPLATFLSDYGLVDHYTAAVKARILKDCPSATIVDISHQVKNGNIAQAGCLLQAVYHDFPKGTVHLVAVGAANTKSGRFLAIELDGHYFVAPDNGVWSLISKEQPTNSVVVHAAEELGTTFPGKFVLAPIVAELLNGTALADLGEPVEHYEQKLQREVSVSANGIQGHVIHVDHYGNLITNIDLATFQQAKKDRKYVVRFGYEHFHAIHRGYGSKDFGDCVILFNSQHLLEIAINHGNAAELLGLGMNSAISIDFKAEG